MTTKSLQDPAERLKKLADTLRNRNGVDWNTAKFELPREVARVEFFRGKDFERYFAAHEDLLEEYADKSSGRTVEERTADIGKRFLRNGFVQKAQRKFKKPKPGKKRLVKWPRTLLPYPQRKAIEILERPTSAWTYIMSTLLVLMIFAGCLLPIAPYYVKLCVFYMSLSLLLFIAGFLLVRTGVWLTVWMVAGRDLWILPNVLSDESSLKEAFTPWIAFTKTEGPRAHIVLRVLAGVGLVVLCWFLLSRNPGGKDVRERTREAHDALLDMLSIRQQITESTSSTESQSEL